MRLSLGKPSKELTMLLCRLVEHGLRHNFLLHLFNLWDNSLLNSRAIIDCMIIVDHDAVRPCVHLLL